MTKSPQNKSFPVPLEVQKAKEALKNAGFEAYLVGGCVRDLILGKKPKDWDITTNAKPEEIISLFPKTYYENGFGTVGVVNEDALDQTLKIIEITPYRTESGYSDFRRPDEVKFSDKLEDDLKRRDFTINAIAYDHIKGQIVDPYKGQEDLGAKIIRTVGNPEERFGEDGLRILRAVRFHAELSFTIEPNTEKALKNKVDLLSKIAKERIRDEFLKIIMSENPAESLDICQKLGILRYISKEHESGVGVSQNKSHIYDVWTHSLKALGHAAKKNFSLEVRLGALLHDVGKPKTKRKTAGQDATFYGHEVVGARMAENILKDLRLPKEIIEKVSKLIRWHMFFSDTEQITLSAVRRMIANVGRENIWELMNLRACDRIGMGRPKENPYRLRKYKSMIEEALTAPISVGMLKIDGKKVMEVAKLTPGPKIGYILHCLLEEVLDDPKLNTEDYLGKRAVELSKLNDEELKKIGEKGKEKKDEIQEEQIKEIRKKFGV